MQVAQRGGGCPIPGDTQGQAGRGSKQPDLPVGVPAFPHSWPQHAALNLLGDYQCDGVVISPMWILTAAHCKAARELQILFTPLKLPFCPSSCEW
uniref:Peptidase S1 domain-containing protein n=1 Tax=Gallus gallus TaxID=9031 RepID=A0A8V0Y7Y2_CHICK